MISSKYILYLSINFPSLSNSYPYPFAAYAAFIASTVSPFLTRFFCLRYVSFDNITP